MNTLPSSEDINEIMWTGLWEQIQSRSAEILGIPVSSAWTHRVIPGWFTAEQVYILEHEGEKVVLKAWKDTKLLQDAATEELINQHEKGIAPQVLQKWEGVKASGEKYYWVLQEFIPGEKLEEYNQKHVLTEEHKKNLAHQLGLLHEIRPSWEIFFGRTLAPSENRNKNFESFIERIEKYITSSPCFDARRISRLLKAIQYLQKKVAGKVIWPRLIHGDFHDGNIIIQDEKSSRIIDFWDAAWSTPEMEFAIMFSHKWALEDLKTYRDIITYYEAEFWPLDQDIFDLCSLSYGAFKTVKRFGRNSPDRGVWDKIIEPLLQKIEQARI